MSDENLIEDWGFEIGFEFENWIGSGDFGDAYAVTGDLVVKITSDKNEFIQTFKTLNNKSKNLPEIKAMRVFDNGRLGIVMELLNT